jgi:hypothetical protein
VRRIKVILAVAALLVAMIVASAAPAFANGNDNDRNDNRDFNNCCFNSFVNESSFFPFFFGFNNFGEDDFFNTGFDGIHNGVFQEAG